MGQDSFRKTLPLQAAVRMSGPLAFHLMVKPGGSRCNLGCSYCYYLDKEALYGGREPGMSEELLETVIRSYLETVEVPEVQFNWHGGEPLVMGKSFFRKALAFERKYANGKRIANTLQTNGTLLDREWAELFKEGNFLVGLSLDGPADLHDRFRKDRGGAPTHTKVLRGLRLLQETGVEFNTLTTVNKASEGRGAEVYNYLKAVGSRYMQFLPVAELVTPEGHISSPDGQGSTKAPWSVSSEGFGRFVCDIFDVWVRKDVGECFVGLFDATLSAWCGLPAGTCIYGETCGLNAVVEHNGDVYPCDHFVYPEYRLGNLRDTPLRAMMTSEAQQRFGIDKRNTLPVKCRRCPWLPACHGECPKHRFNQHENVLCEGYKLFYEHAAPAMDRMKQLLEAGRAPADIRYFFKDS